MFLQISDYQTYIKGTILTAITQDTANVRTDAELAAQSQMESSLRNRYDVVAIFTVPQISGVPDYTQRNQLIVMYMIDISLYHIHSRSASQDVPEIRETRYNAAINWLKAVAKLEISPDLPTLPSPLTPEGGTILYGSETKRNNRH
jgi:phage gp36-like protein